MRRKRGNTNIKILQSQLQNFALSEAEEKKDEPIAQRGQKSEIKGSGVSNAVVDAKLNASGRELPVVEKIKKKGIPKDALINTRRLLTM